MIRDDYDQQAGKWICRRIDILTRKGMLDKARQMMNDNLNYPEVCLKKYNELMASGDWRAAIDLLDTAQKNKTMMDTWTSPNWLEMKQALLTEHGSRGEQIENLRQMFHDACDYDEKSNYYTRLKEMVPQDEWKEFFHKLLSEVTHMDLDTMAPYIIKEGEMGCLYQLLTEAEEKDDTDYRTPLKYATVLLPGFRSETGALLVRTFRAYADDHFRSKKQVKAGEYTQFRRDLEKLGKAGYISEMKWLVKHLLTAYGFRYALFRELKAIPLPNC